MPEHALAPRIELLVFRFADGTEYRGRLVGALERLESGGAVRVLDLLFAAVEPASHEPVALSLHGLAVAEVLSFRLDEAERRRSTARALDERTAGVPAEVIRELARDLEPGAAIAAVLLEHVWARALDDAVRSSAGTVLRDERVDARTLAELAPELLTAVRV